MSFRAALPLALAVAACGPGLHSLAIESDPIVTLHGHVDVAGLTRQDPAAPLIGALVWAAVPRLNPVCLAFSDPDLAAACPDPYGVYYGEVEHAAPIDAAGDFSLPLFSLPQARVSIGDAVTRIAYGSLVVAEDLDGDGQLSLTGRLGGRFGGGGGGGDGGPGGPGSCGGSGPTGPTGPSGPSGPSLTDLLPDVIVGASFATLHAAQARVAFREGDFVADSKFYPTPGCAPPLPGFSVFSMPAFTGEPVAAGTCTSVAPTEVVTVPPLSVDDSLAFMCRPLEQGFGAEEPPTDCGPASDLQQLCLSPEILVTIATQICTSITVYALKGCRDDAFCLTPEWDDTAKPPGWWPCP